MGGLGQVTASRLVALKALSVLVDAAVPVGIAAPTVPIKQVRNYEKCHER